MKVDKVIRNDFASGFKVATSTRELNPGPAIRRLIMGWEDLPTKWDLAVCRETRFVVIGNCSDIKGHIWFGIRN